MKINSFKINGFGKLKDKQMELSDGINIIFGENEAGKSSILKFISSMFYGVSKNKNGKDISDFEKYKPWNTEEFSGKIEYTLDTGEGFEVYREFKRKNAVIYNFQKEDISKNFKIDKTKGIEFFIEQTGIDEDTFFSTAITEQEGMKLSKASQNNIIQKISNLISSGDDNISFKKSLDKINKRQNEEVGTDRTSQRPINLVSNKIAKLLEEKKELEFYKESIYDNSLEKENLKIEQKREEIKKDFLKEVKAKQDFNKLKSAEINFNKDLENDYNKKIEELNKKLENNETERVEQNTNFKNYYIALAIFMITFFILMIINPFKLVNFIVVIPVLLIMYKVLKEKKSSEISEKDRKEDTYKIINEIDILKKNKEDYKLNGEEKIAKLESEIEKDRQSLVAKYMNILDIGFIEECFGKTEEEIVREIENKENRINTIRFRLQTMENSSKEISNKLESLAEIEEQLQDAEDEKLELISLNNSYNIAKECLEKAYGKVKENISPKFTRNLCDLISKISNNRYTNVVLNDEEGLIVELQNGNYVPASRLSVGTIDQMYLSLRLSALREISNETLPILLDETFAYFDDERLKNVLEYLANEYKDYQIIIFTCSSREVEILNTLNINYTFHKC